MKNIVLSGVLMFAGIAFSIHAATPENFSGRFVAVTGKGTINAIPDIVSLKLSIKATNKDIPSAKGSTDKVLSQVNQTFTELDIPTSKINTSEIYIYPMYDYIKGKQVLRGYEVKRDIELTEIDVKKLDSLIQNCVKAGVNNISRVVLGTTKREDFIQKALVKAASNAKARAKLLAVNFNASLGPIRSISTNNILFQAPYVNTSNMMNRFSSEAALPETYTGLIKIKAEIRAIFELNIVSHAQGL